jgi:raffinose/stachyose/melibiose transport system substrate-binding protein
MLHDHRLRDTARSGRAIRATFAAVALAAGIAFSGAASAQSLPVWDEYNFEAQAKVMNDLNAKFEAAHSGVKIERTQRSFDDLALTLKLAVSAGNGPTVTKVNQGAGDMGTMVKEKLLVPLDPYISSYGWDKRQSDSVLARDRWSDTGAFGEGPTYGISGLAEIVGLYYNKKLLDEAGVKTPIATFEDFLAALDALKAKGTPPFMIGTAKNHMALHMIAAISQAHIDASNRKELDDLIYGRGGTWKTPGNLESAKLVQDWATNGYFFDGHSGIGGDDAVQLFIAGQGAFLISGTWYFGDMKNNPDIHFMAVPAPAGVKAPLSVGGVDLAWAVTNLAKDQATKDLAASYLDYMVSEEAAVAWANAGYLPATALPEGAQVNLSPLLTEGVDMWKTLNANNAIGHYPDWASPTLLKTIDDNTPLLLAKQQTPEEFIEAMEKDYQGYLASKK